MTESKWLYSKWNVLELIGAAKTNGLNNGDMCLVDNDKLMKSIFPTGNNVFYMAVLSNGKIITACQLMVCCDYPQNNGKIPKCEWSGAVNLYAMLE